MSRFKLTYFIATIGLLAMVSCRQSRHVPDGQYLLDKNQFVFTDEKVAEEGISTIIRQTPNQKLGKMRFRLWLFNAVDSVKIAQKVELRKQRAQRKNVKKLNRQNRINTRRIEKARKKGESEYVKRLVPLKDTIAPRMGIKGWIKYKKGERPVIWDSSLQAKSTSQLEVYLRRKGYYDASVSSSFTDHPKIPKLRAVTYTIHSGKPFIIDSLIMDCKNPEVASLYNNYKKSPDYHQLVGERLDQDLLDEHRAKTAKFLRDQKLFGFSAASIKYTGDTSAIGNKKLKLVMHFYDRQVPDKEQDTVYLIPYQRTEVQAVYFHIIDSTYSNGKFKERVTKVLGAGALKDEIMPTLDTMQYAKIYLSKKQKKKKHIDLAKDSLNPWRITTNYYNYKPAVRPEILELQNYLEPTNPYKEYYVDRSYVRLMQLDVFEVIKPVLKEVKGTSKVEVHYYLVPAKKQSFSFEPRFTNSNGFLGAAASLNYNNRNLFRGSEKLTISFSGGFESQPPIFDETLGGEKIKSAGRSFNTFEIGPSIKLDFPGLFPIRATKLSKRHRPRTVVSAAYNFQQRNDFTRAIFQLNYLWKFYPDKKQVFQLGFPAGAIKFVSIDPSDQFKNTLKQSNDLFLINAYSNQFIWEDFKFLYEYSNKLDRTGKGTLVMNASISNAGWLLSAFKHNELSETGQEMAFGVPYSRFLRLDTDIIYGYPISKKASFHLRSAIGLGIPNGNNTTSLPYDYSFFAGGANDNRGWRARALGPGAYKYYLDLDRTATQIGDVRLGGFAELRYSLTSMFKTAFFVDAGNIWTYREDINRLGGQFQFADFYKQLALSTGVGLRIDMSFFIIRLDLGIPLTNPALPAGSRWIFQSRKAFNEEVETILGPDLKNQVPKPFIPIPSFGIGYPF